MPEQPRLSLLIPVYNNERTLQALADRIRRSLAGWDFEAILVNDGSRDGSLAALRQIAAGDARFKVISFSRNFGQHPAIAAGLDHASGDVCVLMDADLEDQPEHIPTLVAALGAGGADIVYTTKGGAGASARNMTSDLYHKAFSTSVGVTLPRDLGTFRVFTRKVRNALRQFPERHVLYGPLMFYVGFTHAIVQVERGERTGPSSYSFAKRMRLAVNSLVTYSDLPPKLFAATGTIMVLAAFAYSALVLVQYLVFDQRLPQGLTVLVLLLTGLGGMIMFAIGVLGVYIFRIFQEVLARPRYLVDETLNLGSSIDGRT